MMVSRLILRTALLSKKKKIWALMCASAWRARAQRYGGVFWRADEVVFVFSQNAWVQSYGSRCVQAADQFMAMSLAPKR